MEKRKKNIKKGFIVSLVAIIIILIGISSILFIKFQNKNTLRRLKDNYNKYVITSSKTKLYNKNKKSIGYISKNFKLELDDIKNLSVKNKYFKVKNTDYYILYKDVKKTNRFENTNNNDNYIVFNKNVSAKKSIKLYNNKKYIILNDGINVPLLYMDDNNYYVNYLNNIFSIKKDKSIKLIKNNNTNETETKYVSVLHYENISNDCDDSNCIDKETLINHINLLKDNGYHFIDKDLFIKYLGKNARLKQKVILISTDKINDSVKSINNEMNINIVSFDDKDNVKFDNTNMKTTQEDNHNKINRYLIKYYSTDDNILKMANGENVVETEPVKNNNQGIAVLNYHFFYDPATQNCDETICLKVDKFREHLEYLKNNGYKTLTMKEFYKWMYGKIELPEKSVLITVDDGAMGTGKHNGNHLITLLEEYKMHATLFLITGWWDISNYQSKYLDVQSHTNDMHQYGDCGRGQLVCADYNKAKEDLQKSIDIVKDTTSFCYPFYSYDDEAIQAVKDLGFKLAFIGGNVKAKRSNDKFKIPRYPITSDITLNDFINKIS